MTEVRAGKHENMLDMTLPATDIAPREARVALELLQDDLPEGVRDDVLLLVSELVTNSVRHATAGADSRVRVRASASPSRVRVEVSDWGAGFAPGSLGDRRRDETGGFGLYLVESLASRWGIERDTTTCVWFEILPDDTPAAARA